MLKRSWSGDAHEEEVSKRRREDAAKLALSSTVVEALEPPQEPQHASASEPSAPDAGEEPEEPLRSDQLAVQHGEAAQGMAAMVHPLLQPALQQVKDELDMPTGRAASKGEAAEPLDPQAVQAAVAATGRMLPTLGPTKREAYRMFTEAKQSVDEVARAKAVKTDTVIGYLLDVYMNGWPLDFGRLPRLGSEDETAVREAVKGVQSDGGDTGSMKQIRERLVDPEFPYIDIRLQLARDGHLSRGEPASAGPDANTGAAADGTELPPLPDNHQLPRGLCWAEFRQYFIGHPAAVAQERWDSYIENAERVAIRGVPLPPGTHGLTWAGKRVLIEDMEQRGTITHASHGFFIVTVDKENAKPGQKKRSSGGGGGDSSSSSPTETIKKRGYELILADDEDRLGLGQVSGAKEQRRATPRPEPRKPTGVDIADRLWTQKELGIPWSPGKLSPRGGEAAGAAAAAAAAAAGAAAAAAGERGGGGASVQRRSSSAAAEPASKLIVDSWGGCWNSETGMPHILAARDRPGSLQLPPPRQQQYQQYQQQQLLNRLTVHPSVTQLPEHGIDPPDAPAAAYRCEKGKLYMVNGARRVSDGKTWRCEHYKQPSQCHLCGGAGVCEHGRRRSACLVCNKHNPHSHLWRG
jgi:hypothetical protein